jgi:hypothetical protein
MIQVPYHRNGTKVLVYGTEGISEGTNNKNLGIPRNPRILEG